MKASIKFLRTAVVYTRTNNKEKMNKLSLEEQEKLVENFAEKRCYRIMRIFREDNKSGNSFQRPEFQKMINYIEENKWKIKFIIVVDDERLCTTRGGMKEFKKFLWRNRIKKISLSGSVYLHFPRYKKIKYFEF